MLLLGNVTSAFLRVLTLIRHDVENRPTDLGKW